MKKEILKKYKIVYHRGLFDNIKTPENSLLAFKKCLAKKLPIEMDLHLLKDNTVVVFHDNNLKRMVGVNKLIKDCNYEEIKKYTLLNTKQKIPTLNEVLALVNGQVPLDIEMKYDALPWELEKAACKILDKYKGDFVIKSFSPFSLIYFRLFKKNYIRGQLINNYKIKIYYTIYNFFTKPDFLVYNYKIKKLKKHKKIPTFLYTIKNQKDFNKYLNEYDGLVVENKSKFM